MLQYLEPIECTKFSALLVGGYQNKSVHGQMAQPGRIRREGRNRKKWPVDHRDDVMLLLPGSLPKLREYCMNEEGPPPCKERACGHVDVIGWSEKERK